MTKKKHPDPIPEEFLSYDAAAEFWDSHDTTHYSGVFRTVDVAGDLKRRHYEIEIDADLANTLQARPAEKDLLSAGWRAISSRANWPQPNNGTQALLG